MAQPTGRDGRNQWIAFSLLAIFSAFYIFSGHRTWLNIFDEGITLYGADRILRGEHPFRDCFTFFPPGQFYLLAAVFRLFGDCLGAARICTLTIHFAIVVAGYFLSKRLSDRRWAILSAAGCALWIGSLRMYESPTSPAILLSFLSCLALAPWFETKSRGALVMAGCLAGLTAVFRHDYGVYVLLSAGAGIILFGLLQEKASAFSAMRPWGAYFLGFFLAVLLPAALLLRFGRRDDLWLGLVRFPLSISPKYVGHPYPSFGAHPVEAFPFYLPFIAYAGAIVKLARLRRAKACSSRDWLALVVLGLGIAALGHVRGSSDTYHLTGTLLVSFLLLPWLFSARGRAGSAWAWVLCALVIAAADAEAVRFKAEILESTPERLDLVPLNLPRGRWVYLPRGQAQLYERAVRETQACAGPDGRIFSASLRYDVAGLNDVIFYYLAERAAGTRYYHDVGGITTTRPIQKEMIRELEEHQVNCVMLWTVGSGSGATVGGVSSGVTELDEYIRRHFRVYDSFWNYVLLRRAG